MQLYKLYFQSKFDAVVYRFISNQSLRQLIPAAPPLPALGGGQALLAHVAVAVGEVAGRAGLGDRVHYARRGDGVDEGGFLAAYR